MTTTLSEGVKVPDVGSVNWAGDLEVNWNLLNGALANLSGNVKLDRDNIWTGEQSFTLPIVGSITGTASKAIADEDGTNIKTGYGKLAGNQTWTGTNTYTGANAIRFNKTSYVSGTPSENIFYSTVQWGGYVNNTWSAPFTINNAVRTNGYNDTSFRTYSQTSNTLTGFVHETNADASDIAFRPIVNGTHKLGSSSYQWSAVYAQTYYYNGTAWGLDKANVWTGTQTIEQSTYAQLKLKNSTIKLGDAIPSSQKTVGAVVFVGSDNGNMGFMDFRDSAQGNTFIRILARQKYDANGDRSTSGTIYESGIDIGVLNNKTLFVAPTLNAVVHLGTSANKWLTINGINPGALSLPNKDNSVDITSEFTDLTGGDIFYIPPADGWITITADNEIFCAVVSSTHRTTFWCQSASATSISNACVTIPVKYLQHFKARIKSTNAITVTFYPCLGNV